MSVDPGNQWQFDSIHFMVALLILVGGGGCCLDTVPPEPTRFAHPEEQLTGPGFMVLADRREFAVMAFVNAMGYDEEVDGRSMHPVRVRVRRLIDQHLAGYPTEIRRWREYYETRKLATFQYQDYALSLSTDFPFHRIRPDSELGYAHTAERLKGFEDILNDFWRKARLDEIWMQVRPDYLAEIQKYDLATMERQMASLWEYLKMPRHDTLTLVNVPNLLERHYHAIGAHYENFYYTVESPGSHSYDLNIHEYLHSVINPIVEAQDAEVRDKVMPYYHAGKDKHLVRSYRQPITFTYECLVRALDHRLTALWVGTSKADKQAEARVQQLTEDGLTLTLPFYRLLADFEKSDSPFDTYFPIMLNGLPHYEI